MSFKGGSEFISGLDRVSLVLSEAEKVQLEISSLLKNVLAV